MHERLLKHLRQGTAIIKQDRTRGVWMRSEKWIWEKVQRAGKKKFLRTSYSSGLPFPRGRHADPKLANPKGDPCTSYRILINGVNGHFRNNAYNSVRGACLVLHQREKKIRTIQYGYRKWGTRARVFSQTLAHEYSKIEIRQRDRRQGKKRGASMERSKMATKERSPDGLSLPIQNTILINTICYNFTILKIIQWNPINKNKIDLNNRKITT